MSQYNSQSFESRATLPTVANAGVLVEHRSAFKFLVNTNLAVNDLIVLGTLAAGYLPTKLVVDSDGIANLTADILLVNDLDNPSFTLSIASGASFVNAGLANAPITLESLRFKGANSNLFLVAKVKAAASAAMGQEIGVSLTYRSRQTTN